MSTTVDAVSQMGGQDVNKHPKGLYVLFGTEMWERFSFYSMLALFTLYLQDPKEGFSWTSGQATSLYANYLMFVYASPLIGGLIADKITGYRKAVMIGGVFFIIGHGLLSISAVWAVYAALTFLVIGNGFFKPNVSTMVGNLYPEGSALKDRAYNIFYMGINVGAWIAPIIMEIVKSYFGFHAAFAVAAFGMVISVAILWMFKEHVENPTVSDNKPKLSAENEARQDLMNSVPDWKRIAALIVIFLIVIVFWMVFHQNGSTLTYWADDNTAWSVSGTISNSINPFWIIVLTFPLVWFWGFLNKRGKEPSTPTKMAIGMTLTALSFFVLYFAATFGEGQKPTAEQIASGSFRINDRVLGQLKTENVPQEILTKLKEAKGADKTNIVDDRKFSTDTSFSSALSTIVVNLKSDGVSEEVARKVGNVEIAEKGEFGGNGNFAAYLDKVSETAKKDGVPDDVIAKVQSYKNTQFTAEAKLKDAVKRVIGEAETNKYFPAILDRAYLFQVSPFWLLLAYAILSLGELMLSPMGLSLVSKVAPIRMRGLLMGGWFVATAIGNKLTMIGIYWSIWYQSSFFIVLGSMALVMAVVLFFLLKPLKKAMPGV